MLGILVSAVGLVALRGLALSVMWGWFVGPVFRIPALPIAAAVGVGIIMGLFAPRAADASAKDRGKIAHETLVTMLTVLVLLGFGWLAHLFM